ncbi:LppP/LprE family lipoprotein [Rothia dentocariosa]|uniref:LppP/LprE family lipoprotein n=1 Tax=Rothia dentocariosa TaxID=2047 RepID=UPI003A88F295
MRLRKILVSLIAVTITLSACAQSGESNSSSPSSTTNSPIPQQSTVTIYASPQPTLSTISTPTVSTVEPVQQSPTVSSTTPNTSCTSKTRAEAVNLAISMQNRKTAWQEVTTNGDNYSPCAELSWITISEGPCCTAMQPTPILLFHHGEYVGTATSKEIGAMPKVSRVSENKIEVQYIYLKEGESNAQASGVATAYFTWDSNTHQVIQSGDLPPNAYKR